MNKPFITFCTLAVVLASNPVIVKAGAVNEQWVRTYNGTADDEDHANAVAVDHSGNVIVTGRSTSSLSTGSDIYTAKYSGADGTLLWERRYNGPKSLANSSDSGSAIALDADDNVIITGYATLSASSYCDTYTAKYAAATGAVLWERIHASPVDSPDFGNSIAVDANGDVFIAGTDMNNTRGYLAKYAGIDGAVLWEKNYAFDIYLNAIALDAAGNLIATERNGSSVSPPYTAYAAKYASNGTLLWRQAYSGGVSQSAFNAVTTDPSGNVVVTGQTFNNTTRYDFYTAKYAAATGALIWSRSYTGSGGATDQLGRIVATDANGNVVVTGFSQPCYIAKYAAANGALLWEQQDANGSEVMGLRIDAAGDVIAARSGIYVLKYAAADGALIWQMHHNGFFQYGADPVSPMALMPDGQPVVGGYFNNGSNNDFLTIRYGIATPHIAIEQPTGSALSDGSGRVSFGVALTGGSASRTFTIRSTGSADLTGLGITFDGADASDFTVTTAPVTPVAPGTSTTCTVTFAPTIAGSKAAVVHVASNVSGVENPFDINLTGRALDRLGDDDGDGVTNEAEMNLASFGFDPLVDNAALRASLQNNATGLGLHTQAEIDLSRTAGRDDVLNAPNTYSLYSLSQVQTLNADTPLLTKEAGSGQFKLTVGIKKSTNLANGFSTFPFQAPTTTINTNGEIEFLFTVPDDAAFFRVEAH